MSSYNLVKTILVPVPLSPDFSVPLQQALYFHEVYGSEIILMNVVDDFVLFPGIVNHKKRKRHNRKAKVKLEEMIKGYFKGNIPEHVVLRVETGKLISTILKIAGQLKCDLIIIKKAERIRKRFHLLKAENADKLIAEAVCPVLTIIDKPTEDGIRNILMPVDIFKKTSNKVAWSISLAKKFKATLHVISVLNIDIDVKDSLAYNKCKRIEATIKKKGIEVNTVILNAAGKPPEEAVLNFMADLMPDMIMIMTHQESILFDNYLGSFAREIIHRSPVPVFSVVPCKETVLDRFMSRTV